MSSTQAKLLAYRKRQHVAEGLKNCATPYSSHEQRLSPCEELRATRAQDTTWAYHWLLVTHTGNTGCCAVQRLIKNHAMIRVMCCSNEVMRARNFCGGGTRERGAKGGRGAMARDSYSEIRQVKRNRHRDSRAPVCWGAANAGFALSRKHAA
jgi:hypothetical protein